MLFLLLFQRDFQAKEIRLDKILWNLLGLSKQLFLLTDSVSLNILSKV